MGPDRTRPDADALRRAYAQKLLAHNAITGDAALFRAFALVPRERFLGPPPFRMLGFGRRALRVRADDLDSVYRDALFVLDPCKGINNGEPSLHALLIHALAPRPGERIAHIGAGTGYYTAILAELVEPRGHVLAVEADAHLARMARDNLAGRANVEIVAGDGAAYPQTPVDGIYVNFATAAPVDNWIARLNPGGRLIFPLGVPEGEPGGIRYSRVGAMLRIERQGDAYAAFFICPVSFIFGEGAAGAADPEEVARLDRAFRSGHLSQVKSLVWHRAADPAHCWFQAEDWSLCTDSPATS